MSTLRRWLIGRTADCDIVVSQAEVSSNHCRLTRADKGFLLEDLGSSNGTYVNGVRISKPTLVQQTDHITLGQKIPFPWPEFPPPVPKPTPPPLGIRIGRAAGQ